MSWIAFCGGIFLGTIFGIVVVALLIEAKEASNHGHYDSRIEKRGA